MAFAQRGFNLKNEMAGSRGDLNRGRPAFSKQVALCGAAWTAVAAGVCIAAAPAVAQAPAPSQPQIAKIVVTAERIENDVQHSSLDIQVLSGDDLTRGNVTSVYQLNFNVPGLAIGGGGGGAAQIYLRGVGDFSASALSNPAVGVNVDGVYIARPQAVSTSFYDLQRVEVVKGPQGTFYGRNTSGGDINLITNAPSLDKVGGFAQIGYGNFSDAPNIEAALNVPLGDTFAVRVSGLYNHQDGYLSDGTDDDLTAAGRARILFQPTERFSVILSGEYAHQGGKGPGYVLRPRVTNDPWDGGSDPASNAFLAAAQGVPFTPFPFVAPGVGTDSFRDNNFWNVSAEINWNLGPITATFIPAYRDSQFAERNYPAGLRNTIPETSTDPAFPDYAPGRSKETTAELRFANHGERIKWVAGAYYLNEDQNVEQQIFEGQQQDSNGFYNPTTKSYAAFGQTTIGITKTFRAIAGVRYNHDEVDVHGLIQTNSPLVACGIPSFDGSNTCAPFFITLPATFETFGGDKTFEKTTWRAGLEYDITPSNMAYATASTGFKAGGFNQTIAPDDTYKPEELTAYEVGLRNQFFGKRLQANIGLFDYDYKDMQIAHVKFDPLGQINLITDNAGKATLYGADADVEWLLGYHDRVHLAAEYNHAEFDNFVFTTVNTSFFTQIFKAASTGCDAHQINGNPFTDLSTTRTIDCSHMQMPRAPEWSGSASYDHTFSLAGGAELNAMGSVFFAAQRWGNFDYVAPEKEPSYATLDFDLAYTAPGAKWSLSTYVHNLTNENVYLGGGEQGFAPPLTYSTIAPPRTYGVRLRYNIQ
jgi:iron complex outermembrane receptor protein